MVRLGFYCETMNIEFHSMLMMFCCLLLTQIILVLSCHQSLVSLVRFQGTKSIIASWKPCRAVPGQPRLISLSDGHLQALLTWASEYQQILKSCIIEIKKSCFIWHGKKPGLIMKTLQLPIDQ